MSTKQWLLLKGHGDSGKNSAEWWKFGFTQHQIQQLLKLIPQSARVEQAQTKSDGEQSFAGSVVCCCSSLKTPEWIVDTGATSHIVSKFKGLKDVKDSTNVTHITMPYGGKVEIAHEDCSI